MHFSLRTLLVATTAVAIYVGGLLGLYRTIASAGISNAFAAMQAICGLPIFVLWCIAAEWAFRRRSQIPAARLLLAAILTSAAWRLFSPLFYTFCIRFISLNSSGNVNAYQWLNLLSTSLQSLFEFASWLLMTYAFVQGTKATPERSSPSSLQSEMTCD